LRSRNVARRELKHDADRSDSETGKRLVAALDYRAKTEVGEKAELAAGLAEYAESLI